MSHTPGPWTVVQRRDQEWDIDTGPDPLLGHLNWSGMATVYGSEDDRRAGSIVGEANARLIAAAPDLLEALENLKGRISAFNGQTACSPEFEAACKAIAKAREKE